MNTNVSNMMQIPKWASQRRLRGMQRDEIVDRWTTAAITRPSATWLQLMC